MSAFPGKSKRSFRALASLFWLGSIAGQGALFHWVPIDDAYISFRYAQNLAAGHGLVFNAGERVEGYTNFLWTAMLGGAASLGLDIEATARALGVLFAWIACIATYALARRIAAERDWPAELALLPPTILALYPGWPYWAQAGMEPPLLAAFATVFLLVCLREEARPSHYLLAGLLGALMMLARWDAALLWIPAVLFAPLFRGPGRLRGLATAVGLAALLFATYFLARYSYYGDLLPNTFYAKIGGHLAQRVLRGTFYAGELALAFLLPVTLLSWLARGRRPASLLLAATPVFYAAYLAWTGGDFFPWLRFAAPVVPASCVLLADLVPALAAWEAGGSARRRALACSAALAVTVFAVSFRFDHLAAIEHRDLVRMWGVVGDEVNAILPADYAIALAPVGAVGFRSGHPVLDLLGLTDRHIAHQGLWDPHEAVGHQRRDTEYVLERAPEVVLGQAPLFSYVPQPAEVIRTCGRRAIYELCTNGEFQARYQFDVVPVGDEFLPLWIRRDRAQMLAGIDVLP